MKSGHSFSLRRTPYPHQGPTINGDHILRRFWNPWLLTEEMFILPQ